MIFKEENLKFRFYEKNLFEFASEISFNFK